MKKSMTKNNNKSYITGALLGLLALTLYFVLPLFENVPYKIFNLDSNTMPEWFKISYSLLFQFLIVVVIIFVLNKSIKKDFIDIKKNHKEYFSKCLKIYLIGLGVMMFSNLIINFVLDGGIAENEEAIRKLFEVSPIYVFFTATVFAPVLEELVFRRAIKNIFKSDILFVLVSGFIFGGLHVIGSEKLFSDIIHLVPYLSLGISFAYMLNKANNIFVPIGFHLMHNGILVTIQFIVLLFG